jgi:membrane-associated phospholipid phosphatase
MPKVLLGLLILGATLVATSPACADTDEDPGAGRPLEWSPRWPRFRSWEYAGTAVLGAATLALQFRVEAPSQPRFSGGVLFDGFAREHLRAGTAAGRARAGRVSDLFWWGGTAVPLLVDVPVALFAHRNPGVAGQLTMMNLEAFALAGFTNRLVELGAGRGRPGRDRCDGPDAQEYSCGKPDGAVSLPSGHTMITATAAGLTCVHHRYLPLWGSRAADAGACAIMVAATAITGTTRLISDRHHATDVLLGAALGFGIGYGTPWLLHYRHGLESSAEAPRMVLLPMVSEDRLGAMAVAAF